MKYLFTLLAFCASYCATAQLRLDSVLSIDAVSLGSSYIILQSDSTYYLSGANCYETDIFYGKWYVNKDTLILAPAKDADWVIIKSISCNKRKNDSLIRIYVKDKRGNNVVTDKLQFFYSDNQKVDDYIISNDGYIDIPVNSVKEFTYHYYAFDEYVVKTIQVTDMDIEIIFNPHAYMLDRAVLQKTSTQVEKYIIKNDGLYDMNNPTVRYYQYR